MTAVLKSWNIIIRYNDVNHLSFHGHCAQHFFREKFENEIDKISIFIITKVKKNNYKNSISLQKNGKTVNHENGNGNCEIDQQKKTHKKDPKYRSEKRPTKSVAPK